MNILQDIKAHKLEKVSQRKALYPTALLEKSTYFNAPTVSLSHYILREDKEGIIAEFKKRSPSRPSINLYADIEEISIGYMQAGASALSVLTDEHFFGGSSADLETARAYNFCPILRKDFIVDEYQVIEARSIGADAILLIAEILDADQVKVLSKLARSIGMEVLMEVHSSDQLDKWIPGINLIGVNNRDLKTFETDLSTAEKMATNIPSEAVAIAESGIKSAEDILRLRSAGFQGFLIGELFMSTPNPPATCASLIAQLRSS